LSLEHSPARQAKGRPRHSPDLELTRLRTITDVMYELQCSRTKVDKLIKTGVLKVVRLGKRCPRITAKSVQVLKERGYQPDDGGSA
jgi:hypothetical protein